MIQNDAKIFKIQIDKPLLSSRTWKVPVWTFSGLTAPSLVAENHGELLV